jgi:hypothetical protein
MHPKGARGESGKGVPEPGGRKLKELHMLGMLVVLLSTSPLKS